jgi:hypothetical protein
MITMLYFIFFCWDPHCSHCTRYVTVPAEEVCKIPALQLRTVGQAIAGWGNPKLIYPM